MARAASWVPPPAAAAARTRAAPRYGAAPPSPLAPRLKGDEVKGEVESRGVRIESPGVTPGSGLSWAVSWAVGDAAWRASVLPEVVPTRSPALGGARPSLRG